VGGLNPCINLAGYATAGTNGRLLHADDEWVWFLKGACSTMSISIIEIEIEIEIEIDTGFQTRFQTGLLISCTVEPGTYIGNSRARSMSISISMIESISGKRSLLVPLIEIDIVEQVLNIYGLLNV
jgi:hypothetical protein